MYYCSFFITFVWITNLNSCLDVKIYYFGQVFNAMFVSICLVAMCKRFDDEERLCGERMTFESFEGLDDDMVMAWLYYM